MKHQTNNKIKIVFGAILCSGIILACSESFMKSSVKDNTTLATELAASADAAGNFSAAMDPNSTSTQVLRASSGNVAGSALSMPPGALSIPVSIMIGEGETLATDSAATQIGLSGNSASSAGPAVSFMPSSNIQASSPFTLAIPFSATSLALDSSTVNVENLVVMYKWMKVEDGVVSYSIGLLPRQELTVGAKSVQFQTNKFGTFQLAVTAVKVTEKIDKPTDEPPVMKADATNPLVGVWGQCLTKDQVSSSSGNDGSSSGTTPVIPTVTNACNPISVNSAGTIIRKLQIDFSSVPAVTGAASEGLSIHHKDASTGTTNTYFQPIQNVLHYNGTALTNHAFVEFPQTSTSVAALDSVWIDAVGGCMFENSNGSRYSTISYGNSIPPRSLSFTVTKATPATQFYYLNHQLADGTPVSFNTISGATSVSGINYNEVFYIHVINTDNYSFKKVDGTAVSVTVDGTPSSFSVTFNTLCQPLAPQIKLVCSGSTSTGSDSGKLGIPSTVKTSQREFVKFSSDTFIHSKTSFAGDQCDGEMISRKEETGSYTMGADEGGGVYSIQISMATQKAAIFPQAAVDYANKYPTEAGCGASDWQAAIPKNLEGTQCEGTGENKAPDRVKISDGKIYFENDGQFSDTDSMTKQ